MSNHTGGWRCLGLRRCSFKTPPTMALDCCLWYSARWFQHLRHCSGLRLGVRPTARHLEHGQLPWTRHQL